MSTQTLDQLIETQMRVLRELYALRDAARADTYDDEVSQTPGAVTREELDEELDAYQRMGELIASQTPEQLAARAARFGTGPVPDPEMSEW